MAAGRGSDPAGRSGGGPFGGRGGSVDAEQNPINSRTRRPTFLASPSVNEAKPVTVGLGQELLDINFSMLLVRAAHITGLVTNPDGTPTTSGNVNLVAEGTTTGGQIGANFGSRIQWDGAFSIANVPPGRYVLRARGDDTDTPQFASQPITVNGAGPRRCHRGAGSGRHDQRHRRVPAGQVGRRPTSRRCASRRRRPIRVRSVRSRTHAWTRTDASRSPASRRDRT